MIQTAAHITLLAPVPFEHLATGRAVAETEGRVAFGRNAWQVFEELDARRKGMPVDVYIYASRVEGPLSFEVSWRGRYIRRVLNDGGGHPDGMRYRPPSTASDTPAGVFWEVEDLHPLQATDRIGLAAFTGFGKKKSYGPGFVPEGPLLVEHP